MPYVILHNNDSQGSRAPEFAEHVAGLARVSRRNGQFTEQTTAGVAALAEQNRNVIWMGHSNGERGQILTSGGRPITSNSFCQLILPLQPERLVIASCCAALWVGRNLDNFRDILGNGVEIDAPTTIIDGMTLRYCIKTLLTGTAATAFGEVQNT